MAELLTAETVQAILGLITVVASSLFALYLKRYGDEKGRRIEAEEQGDLILSGAKAVYSAAEALYGANEKAQPYLMNAKRLLDALEAAWNDAQAGTPSMKEIYDELLAVLRELGKAMG